MNDDLILYVDDERANRIVFEQTFRRHFNVRCAKGGEEALAILSEGEVAVLLADLRMPGMSGHKLLELTRERHPDVVRVVITAYGDLNLILGAVNRGLVVRYLVKPWDRMELQRILTWCLEAHALARQGSMLQLRLMQFDRLVASGTIGATVLRNLQEPISSMRLYIDRLSKHATLIRELLPSCPSSPRGSDLEDAVAALPHLIMELQLAADIICGMAEQLRNLQWPDKAPAA